MYTGMKRQPEVLLKEIASLQQMERGKLCRMRRGPNGDYYNHQTWEKGKNTVRDVPRDQVASLKHAIAGYQKFLRLTQIYADEIIRRSRQPSKNNPKTIVP
jgi:hypothetical protein